MPALRPRRDHPRESLTMRRPYTWTYSMHRAELEAAKAAWRDRFDALGLDRLVDAHRRRTEQIARDVLSKHGHTKQGRLEPPVHGTRPARRR
jgi:hypothetical protein